MISQTAEYALRAVVFLAINSGGSYTTQQIALSTKVPFAYLSKVLQSLVRAGFLQSQRGLGGGFSLVVNPKGLSLLQIVDAVEPLQRIRTCPLGIEEHGSKLCALHKRIDEAAALIESVFADTTIAELLAHPTESLPLCQQPAAD